MPPPTDLGLSRRPSPAVPLPQVPGPKLNPFTPTAQADIEFIRSLGNPKDLDSQVWKVKINKHGPYALKMFYFTHWEYLEEAPAKYLNRPLAKPQYYVDYFDPFNCECRAYGRIKQENREDLAIQAYGYLLLTPEQEAEVTRRIDGDDLDAEPGGNAQEGVLSGDNLWGRWEQHRGKPIRAIVKHLVNPDADYFKKADIPRLWSDLDELHKLGILVRDAHAANYLDGKLIDFSRAWTMYHPCLDRIPAGVLREIRRSDAKGVFDLVVEWIYQNLDDQVDIPESLQYDANTLGDDCGYDPRRYDWRKWEDDVSMVEAHIAHELFTDWEAWEERKFADKLGLISYPTLTGEDGSG